VPIHLKLFQKNCRGRNTSKFILRDHHHPVIKIRKRHDKKRKLQANITDEQDAEILKKLLANRIQQHIIKNIHALFFSPPSYVWLSLLPMMSSHKTLRVKQFLAKKQKQNCPIPQWIQTKTSKIRDNSKKRHWRKTKLGL